MRWLFRYIAFGFLLFLFFQGSAQINLGKLTYDDGLSNSTVLSISRSNEGFLWIGTRDGLNRYDGVSLKQYRSIATDTNTISTNNYIYAIADHPTKSQMWVGTQNGLNIFEKEQNKFRRIPHDKLISTGSQHFAVLSILFSDTVTYLGTNNGIAIIKDPDNPEITATDLLKGQEVNMIVRDGKNLLIGTNKGLYLLKNEKKLTPIKAIANDPFIVRDVQRISSDRIWVATEGFGLLELDNSYTVRQKYLQPQGLSSNFVRSIAIDKSGNRWVGTMEGIDVQRNGDSRFETIRYDPLNPFGLTDNSIKTILVDHQDIVWIGTNFGGLNYYNTGAYNFHVDAADGHPQNISGNLVSAIARDDEGNLWVGTERDGLNFRKKGESNYQKIRLRSTTIKCLLADEQYIYAGTFDAGLALIDRKNHHNIRYLNTSGENGLPLKQNYISSIAKDRWGNIWVGTGNSGIHVLTNGRSEVISLDRQSSPAISNIYIKDILVTRKGEIWIGTALGINRLSPKDSQSPMAYSSDSLMGNSYVNTLFEDPDENVWIGTQERGLFKYTAENNNMEAIHLFPNITSYHVLGITNGNAKEIFVTTNRGIVRYNYATQNATFKSVQDGLPTNQFLAKAILNHNGHVLVGSYKGLININVSDKQINTTSPRILITDILVNGANSEDFSKILDAPNPNEIKRISLQHHQNTFSIHFASDNLINPQKNSFAYKIEELDREWIITENPNITYTNLSPGKYTLLLRTANNDGIWSDENRTIILSISPPFYKSTWAYLIYLLLLGAVVYFIYKYNLDKKELTTKLYYEEKHHRDQELLLQSKVDFFTKIGHEIRTPLTLIYAPIDKLLKEGSVEKQAKRQLSIVSKNIERLLRLMNEALTFSKMDATKLQVSPKSIEPQSYFYDLYEAFVPIAEETETNYALDNQLANYFEADPVQLEKVIVNLLANAFKFKQEKSPKIKLQILAQGDNVLIHVKDNGKGIHPSDSKKIFDNFYQGNTEKSSEGWGIGLSLAKEIVTLHHGSIYVNQDPAVQEEYVTVFTIELPDSIIPMAEQQETDHDTPENIVQTGQNNVDLLLSDSKQYHILLVEDNNELREFLVNHLKNTYTVTPAGNGKDALHKLNEDGADIIITDIAMPEMDGYELVKTLKAQPDTAHIPVIMLTAKAEGHDHLRGYQYGAINYVTKPFNLTILELQIFNVISAIEQVKEKNREYLFTNKRDDKASSPDAEYLDRLKRHIEENIPDLQFSVVTLASLMNQSQSTLLKKVKTLTGLSVAELIKEVRLNEATRRLMNAEPIASVAYAVGFTDRKYFSREFKKKFGVNPTQYKEQN